MRMNRLVKVTQTRTGPRTVTYIVAPTWRMGAIEKILLALSVIVQTASWIIGKLESWPASSR